MKIHNKEYRIIKKVYGDDHEEYHAEKCILNLFFFKWLKDYIYEIRDYGYGSLVMKYRFPTYQECLDYLTENIEEKIKSINEKTVKNKTIFE